MRARVWGSRGSLASPGPDTVRYGGNTPCVEVRLRDGTLIVFDAGTGIRKLGLSLEREPAERIHLLLSHLHLDHLEGLGFFEPLWRDDVEIHIWGPPSPTHTLVECVATCLSPPLFPVHLRDVPSRLEFHDVPDGEFTIGSARILSSPVEHQGPTVGYRIGENGRSLAYISDHEPARGKNLEFTEPEWISGFALAERADVLVHDSQYTSKEYDERVGWGHSSVEHVVTFGRMTQARQLVMFHHDPLHSDAQLDEMLTRARDLWGPGDPPVLAREGMEL